MSIKIQIKFEEDGFDNKTSKIGVPKSWAEKTVLDVIGLFVKAYNAKSEKQLIASEMHFVDEQGKKVFSDAIVKLTLGDHCDYLLKFGEHIQTVAKQEAKVSAITGKPLVRCKNYGCQQFFDEDDNAEGSCQHHVGPPIFHDTMKCWSCCRDRKAYDFEGFQEIKGCHTGKHSTENVGQVIAASPNNPTTVFEAGEGEGEKEAPKLKSIDAYNASDAAGPTAAEGAAKIMNTRKSSRKDDGTARCQRKGCQQTFLVESNNDTACTYHKGQPVFHDAIKYWSCCEEKKCYDFDEFLAVPGCTIGYHDDGVIDL